MAGVGCGILVMMLSLHLPVVDANCVLSSLLSPPFPPLLSEVRGMGVPKGSSSFTGNHPSSPPPPLNPGRRRQKCAGEGCAQPKQDEMQVGTASNGRLYPCVSVLTTEPGESMRSG